MDSERVVEPSAGFSRRELLLGVGAGLVGSRVLTSRALAAAPLARDGRIGGTCHPRFAEVRREFVRNFDERGEVGASLCVEVDGERVVDLWGGVARVDTGETWRADTLSHVWSATKGATALCAHLLVDRGELDLDAPVATYWPEFAQQGKGGITVAMVLAHQAGVPAIRERLPQGAFYDWDFMVEQLAAEAPFWEPGTRNGYHALTLGFLVGELVRRITGRSLGTFFREEIAQPYDLDFFIGLPESEERRVAPMIDPDPPAPGEKLSIFLEKAITEPGSIPALVFFNTGGYTNPGEADTRAAHEAQIGASGGMTNARGLARMYGAAIGGELVSDDAIARMSRVASATSLDAAGFIPTRFALGFVKSMDNRGQAPGKQDSVILGEQAFGHSGFGGGIGFADPQVRMSFGYTMNKMGQGTALNRRGQSLVDAVYRALGFASDASGSWIDATGREPAGACPRRVPRR